VIADEAKAKEEEPPAQMVGGSSLEAETYLAMVAINQA
jgi:hypothetical protein